MPRRRRCAGGSKRRARKTRMPRLSLKNSSIDQGRGRNRFALARGLRGLLALSGAAALCACISRPVPPHAPASGTAYDWRGLMIMPFGTLLKDSPLALHEVLLFHDTAQEGGDVPHRDCYAPAGEPPLFVGRRPDEYLLCFSDDRLARVDASARLPGDSAGE